MENISINRVDFKDGKVFDAILERIGVPEADGERADVESVEFYVEDFELTSETSGCVRNGKC